MSQHHDFDHEYRLFAIAAARLRSEGKTQIQIAEHLKKSQPEVSRMLDFAEKQGFLAHSPSFLGHKLEPELLREADRRFFLHEKLRQLLAKTAPENLHLNVRVLPDGDEEFASAAASHVVGLICQAQLIGIMWGRTLQRLVARIGEHRDALEKGKCAAQCIPLCGDPVYLMNQGIAKYSASHLAAELSYAITPQASAQPCLVGVPAYLSRRVRKRSGRAAEWQAFVHDIPGYRDIFGPSEGKKEPYVDRLDVILSGMGIIARGPGKRPDEPGASPNGRRPQTTPKAAYDSTGDFILERIAQERAQLSETGLRRLICGDIGGWLIERPGLQAAEREEVASLNHGWTGLKGPCFAAVARKARPAGSPGVILVAAGAAKAPMLKELVRLGYVNEILIDSSLADALED